MEPAMNAFRPVWIHPSVRTEAQSRKRLESLQRGEIDHGFHYQGLKQAELWLKVHRRHAPLFADPSFAEIFRAIAAETASELAGRAVHVIGLGPGGGEKEAWVLEALRSTGCRLRYTPVDTGLELALLSAEAAEPWVEAEIQPVVGDLSLLEEFPPWLERYPQDELRVYTAFGLTPNFLPGQIFPWLSAALREEDVLLLSANLAPAEDGSEEAYHAACGKILPQYDNPETLAWLRHILADWGIAPLLGEPCFQIQAMDGLLGFVAHCRWLSDVSFPWEGQPFSARHGERLRLFFSLRYTPGRLAAVLGQYGLSLKPGHVTPCGQEGVWTVGRSAGTGA